MKAVVVASILTVLIATAGGAMAQSVESGERTFNQQCKACHTVDKGGASTIGPNLFGVMGRKAGTAVGFSFSDAMKASAITWDDASLGDYLTDPKAKVPGGKMVFAGVKRPAQLADVIAYLRKATQ